MNHDKDMEPPSRGELDSTATRMRSAETKSDTPEGIPNNTEDKIHSTNHAFQTYQNNSHKKRGTISEIRTKERAENMKERRTTIPDKRNNDTYFKTRFMGTPNWITEQARLLVNKQEAQEAPTDKTNIGTEQQQKSKHENKSIGQICRAQFNNKHERYPSWNTTFQQSYS